MSLLLHDRVQISPPLNSGDFLVPDGVRWLMSDGERTSFVYEEEPQLRVISYKKGLREEEGEIVSYKVATPRVFFVGNYWHKRYGPDYDYRLYSYLVFANKPFEKIDQLVSRPFLLPNSVGELCWKIDVEPSANLLSDIINQYQIGWTTVFNDDLGIALLHRWDESYPSKYVGYKGRPIAINSFEGWQDLSRAYPDFGQEMEFRCTLSLMDCIKWFF